MKKLTFLLACSIFPLQGCGLFAPLIQSARSVGVTEGDRKNLLNQELAKFNNALYWGNIDEVLSRTLPDARSELLTQLRKSKNEEHLVESKVDYVDYANDAYDATVYMTVKYYKVPFYVVTDRHEIHTWRFGLRDGWKLASRTIDETKKKG